MSKNPRCSYNKITEAARVQIIQRILQNGQNISEVARDLDLNISTCRAILKVYQQEGRVGKKKRRNKVYNVIETFSFFTVDGQQVQQLGDIKVEQRKVSFERGEDYDKLIEDQARTKAENLLEGVLEERRRVEKEAVSQHQNQLMQCYLMQNGYLPSLNQFIPMQPPPEVKIENSASIIHASSSNV